MRKHYSYKKFSNTRLSLSLRIGLCLIIVPLGLCIGIAAVQAGAQSGPVLQGRILDENDQPQAGATVSVSFDGIFVQSALSLRDGQFTMNLPRAGQYQVRIELDGFRPHNEIVQLGKDETIFRLCKLIPSSLHVVVLDLLQEKLPDATVTIKGEDDAIKRAIESPKGDYYFGRLKPGIYQLTASMPGYEVSVDDGVYISPGNKTLFRPLLAKPASSIPIGDKLKDRYGVPSLPANTVQALWQDRLGTIWLGTSRGIARFNGSEITSSDGQDNLLVKLVGRDIRVLFQDSSDRIWFATESELHVKQPGARTIEAVPLLAGRNIRAITEDQQGALWFATNRGAVRYLDGSITEYTTHTGLPSDDVRHISTTSAGEGVWIATAEGVVRLVNTVVEPLLDGDQPVNWPTNFVLIDSRKTVWFLTEMGLKRLDGEQVVTIPKEGLTRPLRVGVEDRMGNLWFAATSGGAYVYDLRRDDVDDLLTDERVLALLADREGNVWFGTDNGAVRQDFYSFVNFNTSRGLPDTNIFCLLPDPTQPEALWVGTEKGLVHFDGVRFRRVNGIPNIEIRHIVRQANGVLWFATSDGLYRLQNEKWQRFGSEHGLASIDIRALCEDVRDSKLWVATKKGISRFDTGFETGVNAAVAPEQLQITADVRYIFQQSSGLLWFATNRGIYRYDPTTYDLTIIGQNTGLESVDVRWIEGDEAAGLLWLATAKGIELFNGQRTTPEKLPAGLASDNTQCIFRDRDGMLWISSADGRINKINSSIPGIETLITTYTRDRHGLAGNIIRHITQDSSGALWFATESGLTRHLPSRVVPTVDCRLEVDGAEVLTRDIAAGLHNIKFRFIGLSAFGEISFVHRIIVNGQPREWRLVTPQTGSREALFNDLPDGEHIFEVRAINRDLYGVNAPSLEIRLRIDRPFWKKLWFYLFIGFTVMGATITTVVVRQRQRREYMLPPHLRTFVPIDPNPYIVGNPIRNPAMFFGREDDFNYVKIKLEGAAQGGVVLVFCGERRAGKSSILYQILNGRLGERFIPVFIDLQEMVVSSDHEFFGRIAKLIAEAISHAKSEQNEQDPVSTTTQLQQYRFSDQSKNAFHLFLDFLDRVLIEIVDRRLLILMDEYELLENKVEDNKLSKEIFTFMASLIDNHDRLAFLFTGSRRLEERDRRYWREMLRRSLYRKVSFLSEQDAKRLITEPVKDKLVYGRGVENAIYRLTSGQPFYTQYICQAIVDHLNEWKRNYVLKADLKQVTDEIVDNPLPQMIYFWEGFSDDEKLVMSLLAEELEDADAAATSLQIAQAITREHYPVKLSEDTIRLTLEELFRTDVLKKIGDEAFCFRIDLLRLWIKQSHSIWSVVREVRTL
ncbi:MAG: two-component regulator propeller domain-containing protein [Acidobacteriota bacterium]